jgi:hypothetical protein
MMKDEDDMDDYNDNMENEDRELSDGYLNEFIESKEFDSKEKIIKLLEIEYDYLEKQQVALFYSNEEMLKYDTNDIAIIEARSENVKIIGKNIERMKKIRNDILNLDKEHYIAGKNIYDFNMKTIIKYDKEEEFDKLQLNSVEIREPLGSNSEDIIVKHIDL